MILAEADQSAASLEWYSKAIRFLEDATKAEPNYPNAREFLRNGYWNRAISLKALGRNEDAIPDWTRSVELAENDRDRARRLFNWVGPA